MIHFFLQVRVLFFILLTTFICSRCFGDIDSNSLPVNDLQSQDQEYFITSKWDGQLGNQLFCVASTLAYAWDNNLKPLFPFLNELDHNKSYNRDRIFFRLDTSSCPRPFKHTVHFTTSYVPIPPSLVDLYLEGPFFCWKYYHHHREKLLEVLSPSEKVLSYLYAKYGDLISNPKTVSIHVRSTSRYIHNFCFPFPGLKYFELAINEFPSDSLFVVFSDRIKWCEKNFRERFPEKTFVFIDGNDHIEDLFLISLMKHNILSNLTYSFWGAYLNKNPEKRVCVPMRQVRPPHNWTNHEYYLPEWKVIPYDFINDPYPEDMYWYDEKSKSLDEANG